MVKICIVHYNTPKLTECLVRSINKYTPDSVIYIFDNSDESPFTYRQDNIIYFDNTKGQIINFDEWFKKYPNKTPRYWKANKCGSARHCISIQKCIDIIEDNFILLDSDVLLKRDISALNNDNYIFVGEVGKAHNSYNRIFPFLSFINVKKCKELNISYFNEEYMLGLNTTKDCDWYDTGSYFYMKAKSHPHKIIKNKEYIEHFASASWRSIKSQDEWLNKNKNLWHMNEKIIVTMTTWKERIVNIPVVLNTIFSQTKKPDKIVINLSREEFPAYETLPENFRKYVEEHDLIEINWIEGKNTKQWKKIIPTLFKYPEDCVICIDDDRKYPKNFIEALWNTHLKHPNNPITQNRAYKLKGMYLQHAGHGTLDKLEYYNSFKGIDLNEVSKFASSDSFFTLIATNCGHPILPYEGQMGIIAMYNEISPLKKSQKTCNVSSHIEMYNYLTENGIINLAKKPVITNKNEDISQISNIRERIEKKTEQISEQRITTTEKIYKLRQKTKKNLQIFRQ